jgi:hypothetical protein
MKRFPLSIASTAGLLLLAGTPVWASPTPTDVNWSYNFTPSKTLLPASTGTGSISFSNQPTVNATNSSDVVVSNLRLSSTAGSGTPDTFSNAAWHVGLQLTDTASGTSTTMNFGGVLNGTFSASNANVTNSFTSPTSFTWTASNGNTYTVTLTSYTPPGPPTGPNSNAGSISAHVTVTSGTGHTAGVPEPSTLVLSFLGLGFAGIAARRKRRTLAANLA